MKQRARTCAHMPRHCTPRRPSRAVTWRQPKPCALLCAAAATPASRMPVVNEFPMELTKRPAGRRPMAGKPTTRQPTEPNQPTEPPDLVHSVVVLPVVHERQHHVQARRRGACHDPVQAAQRGLKVQPGPDLLRAGRRNDESHVRARVCARVCACASVWGTLARMHMPPLRQPTRAQADAPLPVGLQPNTLPCECPSAHARTASTFRPCIRTRSFCPFGRRPFPAPPHRPHALPGRGTAGRCCAPRCGRC